MLKESLSFSWMRRMSVWLGVPLPAWPRLIVPGFSLAAATTDCQSLKRLLAGTTTTIGTVLSMETGAKAGTIEGLPAISGETNSVP